MGEENNLVNAFQIHKGKVKTSDQQKLGIIVNIIIDSQMDCAARILVFPEEKPWWLEWLAKKGRESLLDLIKTALPDKIDEIRKDIAEKGLDAALQLWKEYLKRRNCYLVSLLEISRIEGETVDLKSSLIQIKEGYSDLDTNESEIAFYPENALANEENKTLLPITLNLPHFKGQVISDQKSRKGKVFNIQLDTKNGQLTDIIVQTAGYPNPGNHIISSKGFDWSTLETNQNLDNAPIYA